MSLLVSGAHCLTTGERTMLSMAAAGFTSTQIAEAVGASRHLVRNVLVSATAKLGARSKLEAVLIADRTGQIDVRPEYHVGC